MIQAISPGGASPLIAAGGIDVLHVNHHGSESSTNPTCYDLAAPSLAVIGVGDGQSTGWDLPRISGWKLVQANATKAQFESFWGKVAATSATPGTNGKTGCSLGVFINENSDAIGTGNYVYEYIELFNDHS